MNIPNMVVEWNGKLYEVIDEECPEAYGNKFLIYKLTQVVEKTTQYITVPAKFVNVVDEISQAWAYWFESEYLLEDWCSEIFQDNDK